MASWGKHKIEKLKLHYRQFNIPSDQIVKDQDTLEKFTEWFNVKFTPKRSLPQKKWRTNYSNSVKVASFHVLEHKQFDGCRSNYDTKVADHCSSFHCQCGDADGDSGTD